MGKKRKKHFLLKNCTDLTGNMANNGFWRVYSLIDLVRDFLSGCNIVNISQGCKDRQPCILGISSWALSWPYLLTPLAYILPAAGGTTIFPATAWLEVGSIFIQTEGRTPGAKLTHTTSWRESVFVGVFPSQLWPNLAVLLIKSDKISAWGGRIAGKRFPCPATPDSVRNRVGKTSKKHLRFCGNVNTVSTPHPLPVRAPQRQGDNGGAFICNSTFYSPGTFLKLRCQMSPWEVSAGSCDVQIRDARGAGRLQERGYWASSFPLAGSVKTYKSIQSHSAHFTSGQITETLLVENLGATVSALPVYFSYEWGKTGYI